MSMLQRSARFNYQSFGERNTVTIWILERISDVRVSMKLMLFQSAEACSFREYRLYE